MYWYTYQSRWIPLERFEGDEAARLADALFEASRHRSFELHFNKGLAGASGDAVRRNRETSMNPAVERAAALVIAAAGDAGHPGVPGREPDRRKAEAEKARVAAAMAIIRRATPGAGSYVNETDYFEPDWQRAFLGRQLCPAARHQAQRGSENLFSCHHCVGSERAR
jgi:hypothetical protein